MGRKKPKCPSACTLTVPAAASGSAQVYRIDLDQLDLALLPMASLLDKFRSNSEAAVLWKPRGPVAADCQMFTVHAARACSPSEDDCKVNPDDTSPIDRQENIQPIKVTQSNIQPKGATSCVLSGTTYCHICSTAVPTDCMTEHSGSTQHLTRLQLAHDFLRRLNNHYDQPIAKIDQTKTIDDHYCAACNVKVGKTLFEAHKTDQKHKRSLKRDDQLAEFYKDYVKDDHVRSQECVVGSVLVQQVSAKVLKVNGDTVAGAGGKNEGKMTSSKSGSGEGKATNGMLGNGQNQGNQTVRVMGNSQKFGSVTNNALGNIRNHGNNTNTILDNSQNQGKPANSELNNSRNYVKTTNTVLSNSRDKEKPAKSVVGNSQNKGKPANSVLSNSQKFEKNTKKRTSGQNLKEIQTQSNVCYCRDCDIYLPNSTHNIREHYIGKNHKKAVDSQRELYKTNTQSPVQTVSRTDLKIAVPSGEIQSRVSDVSKEAAKVQNVSQPTRPLETRQLQSDFNVEQMEYCQICYLNPLMTEQHIHSSEHRWAVVSDYKQKKFEEIKMDLVRKQICLKTCDGTVLYVHLAQWHGLQPNNVFRRYECTLCRKSLTGTGEPYDHITSQQHWQMINYATTRNAIRYLPLSGKYHCIVCNDDFYDLSRHLELKSHSASMVRAMHGDTANVVQCYTEPAVWGFPSVARITVCSAVAWFAVRILGYKKGLILFTGGLIFEKLFLIKK